MPLLSRILPWVSAPKRTIWYMRQSCCSSPDLPPPFFFYLPWEHWWFVLSFQLSELPEWFVTWMVISYHFSYQLPECFVLSFQLSEELEKEADKIMQHYKRMRGRRWEWFTAVEIWQQSSLELCPGGITAVDGANEGHHTTIGCFSWCLLHYIQ